MIRFYQKKMFDVDDTDGEHRIAVEPFVIKNNLKIKLPVSILRIKI